MHDSSKFCSSGKQQEEGIVLLLQDISSEHQNIDDDNCHATETDCKKNLKRSLPPKEWPRDYKITAFCGSCETPVRVAVSATPEEVLKLQQLFLDGLSFYCPTCAKK